MRKTTDPIMATIAILLMLLGVAGAANCAWGFLNATPMRGGGGMPVWREMTFALYALLTTVAGILLQLSRKSQ